jgi:hypothetical protein
MRQPLPDQGASQRGGAEPPVAIAHGAWIKAIDMSGPAFPQGEAAGSPLLPDSSLARRA